MTAQITLPSASQATDTEVQNAIEQHRSQATHSQPQPAVVAGFTSISELPDATAQNRGYFWVVESPQNLAGLYWSTGAEWKRVTVGSQGVEPLTWGAVSQSTWRELASSKWGDF